MSDPTPLTIDEETKFRESVAALRRVEDENGCHAMQWTNHAAERLLATLDSVRLAALSTTPAPTWGEQINEYLDRQSDPTREALVRLVATVLDYSPQYDHDWRCERRTAEAGWTEGMPPVIVCECGFDALGLAVRDAQDVLAALSTTPAPLDAALQREIAVMLHDDACQADDCEGWDRIGSFGKLGWLEMAQRVVAKVRGEPDPEWLATGRASLIDRTAWSSAPPSEGAPHDQ